MKNYHLDVFKALLFIPVLMLGWYAFCLFVGIISIFIIIEELKEEMK